MNKIFDQKGGTCTAMSIANAIESQLGVALSEEEIYQYMDKQKWDKKKGVRLPILLQRLKNDPIRNVKVKDFECLFNDRLKDNDKNYISRVRETLFKNSGKIIFIVKIRNRKKGEPVFNLSNDCFYIPRTTKVTSHHAMFVPRIAKVGVWSWKNYFLVENSWGEDWGKLGYMYIDFHSVMNEVQSIYSVNFEYV